MKHYKEANKTLSFNSNILQRDTMPYFIWNNDAIWRKKWSLFVDDISTWADEW